MELKRINGWDAVGSIPEYDQFYDQYIQIKNELEFSPRTKSNQISSVFEVGCGSGAGLYLFQNDGYHVGGIDYSAHLIDIARRVLTSPVELICEEAANSAWDIRYDAVLSNSVFSYFDNYQYAEKVLEAMYHKANQSIGIRDIHDIEKKEQFFRFRKGIDPHYEERYQDLPKFFMKKYWNNEFVFNCYMRK